MKRIKPNFICIPCDKSINVSCGTCASKFIYDSVTKTGGKNKNIAFCEKHPNISIDVPICASCEKTMVPF